MVDSAVVKLHVGLSAVVAAVTRYAPPLARALPATGGFHPVVVNELLIVGVWADEPPVVRAAMQNSTDVERVPVEPVCCAAEEVELAPLVLSTTPEKVPVAVIIEMDGKQLLLADVIDAVIVPETLGEKTW